MAADLPAGPGEGDRDDGPAGSGAGSRPDRLVVVVGTGTEVGKTWVSARLLERLRAGGHAVAARKPAQSHGPADDAAGTDAAVLARATGEDPAVVCPPEHRYPVAMAPPMAAEALGRPVPGLADLAGAVRWPPALVGGPRQGVGLVETAGGLRSPQAGDGDAIDLALRLRPDVLVLVADAGLGTIHAVRSCLDALSAPTRSPAAPAPTRSPEGPDGSVGGAPARSGHPLPAPVVVLNRFDPSDDLHRRNLHWLRRHDALSPVALPCELDRLVTAVLG